MHMVGRLYYASVNKLSLYVDSGKIDKDEKTYCYAEETAVNITLFL